MRRLLAVVGLSLVMGLSIASAAAPARSASASSTNWKLELKFNNPVATLPYYLTPLKKSGTKLTGTVQPPNESCPGKISGTLKSGKLKLKFTYPGTPCEGQHLSMTGKMSISKGTTSGTFTEKPSCLGKCKFKGKRTS